MDELLHHCFREIAFDGDLGTDVARLKDFISDFYTQSETPRPQNFDNAFYAFAWSLIVKQPNIHIGLVPLGVMTDVWIAPQISAKRKAQARGEPAVQATPATLEAIPSAKDTPLDVLVDMYGDRLRIAVDPDAIFAAITGSHIRSSKLSPMVYSALQIITRGRDAGVTVVELGQTSGYDQKTCFYLVRQLTELDLIVKVRRGGVGTHFCIHKYFFERNPSWNAIRNEEKEAETITSALSLDADDRDDGNRDLSSCTFTPIDARHLSSLPLVSARVIKLLKASKNNIHASNNMLLTLGFSNPTKTDRRFFQSRIREMIQQGIIEKVIVPSNKNKSNIVKCFRLVQGERPPNVEPAPEGDVDEDLDLDDSGTLSGVKVNTALYKQIVDLLEESGTTGMTLNDISFALHQFDKRTIELYLNRADRFDAPPHLGDLRIAGLMETSGRERRHRYYTVKNYQKLVSQEALDKDSAGYQHTDNASVGGFFHLTEDLFYDDTTQLRQYQDSFKADDLSQTPRKTTKRVPKNPILPDGTVKKGRPRKHPPKDVAIGEPGPSTVPAKRRRKAVAEAVDEQQAPDASISTSIPEEEVQVVKRPARGRKHSRRSKGRSKSSSPISIDVEEAPALAEPEPEPVENVLQSPTPVPSLPPIVSLPPPPATSTPLTPLSLVSTSAHESSPHASTRMSVPPLSSISERTRRTSEPTPTPTETSRRIPLTPLTPSTDNPATTSSSRVNVSHLRRENELLRVVENFGGIVNIQSKEFFEAHTQLLETLAAAGEPTSAPPGTRTDKRTATVTIDRLESKGRIKQLKTTVTTHTGATKPACVAYLPDTPQETLNAFLLDLSRNPQPSAAQLISYIKIDEPVEYGADITPQTRGTLPLQLLQIDETNSNEEGKWAKNIDRANQLFTYDDATIQKVLLHERTTLAQVFGFIIARAIRCRELHLSVLKILESNVPSSFTVSQHPKIIDISLLCHGIPVSLYCSLVSTLGYDEDLSDLFSSEEGRNTIVRDLPSKLHSLLQVGRARSRSRFLDLLETLRSLQIVSPLQPSTSSTPLLSCAPNGEYPTAFEPFAGKWTINTPLVAPQYWHFNDTAPVYIWAFAEENPPFWKTMSIATHQEAVSYWNEVRAASLSFPQHAVLCHGAEEASRPSAQSLTLGRSLRRFASWKKEYFLTWHQSQYMKHFIDLATATTPLQITNEQSKEETLKRICWVSSAPRPTVVKYFEDAREKVLRSLEKARRKAAQHARQTSIREESERSQLWAKKAEEARQQREAEWKNLLALVHPGPLPETAAIRIERVQQRFMQAVTVQNCPTWEQDIREALKESELASFQAFRVGRRPLAHHNQTGSPVDTEQAPTLSTIIVEPSVQELIDRQAPRRVPEAQPAKRKRKRDATAQPDEPKKIVRRHRFQWNPDFDELARDASAIIRARCRHLPRLDWGAFEQVFPSVPRNTVRQRLGRMKEVPGIEAYLRRLEDAWHTLWIKHKGTDILPDTDEQSPTNFDLRRHIEFLRTHIDKNALRVGLNQAKETNQVKLPPKVEDVDEHYLVVEVDKTTLEWDFMWNALIEEGRERNLRAKSLTMHSDDHNLLKDIILDNDQALAQGALKMAMGAPAESYDSEIASELLRSRGEDSINTAIKTMLSNGILSKSQRDPTKPRPGRQLKIAETNQNMIGGNVSRDTFQDAVSLLEEVAANDNNWHEWPLTATDGDCAALIQLASDDKVDFEIDTTLPRAARPALDWNSKKADDDQIETAISVRYRLPATADEAQSPEQTMQSTIPSSEQMDEDEDLSQHGWGVDGQPACCGKLFGAKIVDCTQCLDDAWTELAVLFSGEEKEIAEWILGVLASAKADGVPKANILPSSPLPPGQVVRVIDKCTSSPIPLAFWTGYEETVLVSSRYLRGWTVITSKDPVKRTFPRRWFDVRGTKINSYWHAASRAVVGTILFRPGISEAEIQWRLRTVYDRQEVKEVLHYLHNLGQLEPRIAANSQWVRLDTTAPFDENEEKEVFWFLGDGDWYHI